MTAMTPMKCFRIDQLEIYTEDMTGKWELVATADNEAKRDWLISSLRKFHVETPLLTVDNKALAPFTHNQIRALIAYQLDGKNHPYTCINNHVVPRTLIPTHFGWKCPSSLCSYTQDWAHAEHTGVK